MTYQVVFDCTLPPPAVTHIVSSVSSGHGIALAAAFLALAAGLVCVRDWLNELKVIVCLALIGAAYLYAYHRLPTTSQTIVDAPGAPSMCQRPTKVVVGTVADFVPMPYEGHAMEHFCVNGVCFEYSDYERFGGFNNTSSHGGPIRPGLSVRVTYVETRSSFKKYAIVKIEVESDAI